MSIVYLYIKVDINGPLLLIFFLNEKETTLKVKCRTINIGPESFNRNTILFDSPLHNTG